MKILGISHPYSWNNAACLIMDGQIVAFAEEERFNRIKYAPSMAAKQAMEYCLKTGGINFDDLDYIGIGFDSIPGAVLGNLFNQSPGFAYYKIKRNISSIRWGNRKLPFDTNDRRVRFINHHDAHIASSYYLSGFKSSNIISFDGAGGAEAGKIGYGNGTNVDIYDRIPNEASWGRMYEAVTGLLGFMPHGDEGKVMGLSSYGHAEGDYDFIDYSGSFPRIIGHKFKSFLKTIKPRRATEPLTEHHKNIAATLQYNLEKAGLGILKYLTHKTGNRNLCLAGGVALNCAMNGKLIRSRLIDDIFIQPISSDAGTAIGAAVKIYVDESGRLPETKFNHLYFGPEFSNDQIKANLDEFGLKYTLESSIMETAAKLLSEDKIIGWFQGKMEAGPRALGNRSILANPSNPQMKDLVNNKVKKRELWRPFAPSIQKEYTSDYAQNYYLSPFMILAFDSVKERQKDIISAAHVDGTIRVQEVDRSTNPRYWQLIDEFRKITGIPALLNTSFNKAGEPIVCKPEDAIRTFYGSGLDYLAIGDFLVYKR